MHLLPTNTLLRWLFLQKIVRGFRSRAFYTTTVDMIEPFTNEPLQRLISKDRKRFVKDFSMRYFMKLHNTSNVDIKNMTRNEIDNYLQDLMLENKDKEVGKVITECMEKRKSISEITLKKTFRYCSILGKVSIVELLQQYCQKYEPSLHRRNGEFMHYVAKAQCMKGNSEKGLSVLKTAYIKYDGLRNFYRLIFRELIYDSITNRSEASLVIFKKYVLEFSVNFNDSYPLICFWHYLWSSNWFSDQMFSNELLESCAVLQDIVREKATVFSINILKEYNEDAVVRLLQSLLKYNMMAEYSKVLEILFGYKLKNRDLRGCREIIKNCEVLKIALPSNQQGKYIKMLIRNEYTDITGVKSEDKPTKLGEKNFKLKF